MLLFQKVWLTLAVALVLMILLDKFIMKDKTPQWYELAGGFFAIVWVVMAAIITLDQIWK